MELSSNELANRVFEMVKDSVWIMDMNLNFQYSTRSVKWLTQYNQEEIMNISAFNILTPESLERALDTLGRFLENDDPNSEDAQTPVTIELEVMKKDGTILWTENKILFIRDENGTPIGLLGFTNDITERKKAEKALIENEERWRSFITNSLDFIMTTDLDLKVTFVNSPDPKMSLIDRIGLPVYELNEGDDRQKAKLILEEVLNTGEPESFESTLTAKNGQKRLFESRVGPLMQGDKIVGLIINSRDMTQSREFDRIMKDKAKHEIYGFLASAMPVFASNIPISARNLLIKSFCKRFELRLKPQFERSVEIYKNILEKNPKGQADEMMFSATVIWISDLFSNFGIDVEREIQDRKATMSFKTCPWVSVSEVNPIFCILCRSIIIRSFGWSGIEKQPIQKASIGNGSPKCVFNFSL